MDSVRVGECLLLGGGLNRSTQHLLILLEEEVCDGRGLHEYGSRRNRGLSFGSAGRTVNRVADIARALEEGEQERCLSYPGCQWWHCSGAAPESCGSAAA